MASVSWQKKVDEKSYNTGPYYVKLEHPSSFLIEIIDRDDIYAVANIMIVGWSIVKVLDFKARVHCRLSVRPSPARQLVAKLWIWYISRSTLWNVAKILVEIAI